MRKRKPKITATDRTARLKQLQKLIMGAAKRCMAKNVNLREKAQEEMKIRKWQKEQRELINSSN